MALQQTVVVGVVAAVAGMLTTITAPLLAQTYTFTRIADTRTAIPGETGGVTFGSLGSASIDAGNVAFWGCQFSGQDCVNGGQEGIYLSKNGFLSRVADRNTFIPGGQGYLFQDLRNPIVSGDRVVFGGLNRGTPVPSGIYLATGEGLAAIVDWNTQIPGTQQTFHNSFGDYSFDSGNLAFTSVSPVFMDGVYTSIGGTLDVVADLNTPIPDGSGNFAGFENVSVSGENVAFDGGNPRGIYARIGQQLQKIADSNTLMPGLPWPQNFNFLQWPLIDGDEIAFYGSGLFTNIEGIYATEGGYLRVVADNTMFVPGHPPYGMRFGYGLSLDSGQVAFGAGSAIAIGIYTETDHGLVKMIETLDPLDGKALTFLDLSRDGLSRGQLTFTASFADGSQGVFIASPASSGDGTPLPGAFRPACALVANLVCIPLPGGVPAGDNPLVDLISGSPTHLSQKINAPGTPTPLTFDYWFQGTTGTLRVLLDGLEVLSLTAPPERQAGFQTASILIEGEFLGKQGIALDFEVDGPAGSSVWLDNVTFPGLTNGDFSSGDLTGWIAAATAAGSIGVGIGLIAEAGPDQSVDEGTQVALDGSGSSGGVLEWTQVGGPTVSLDTRNPSAPTFVAPAVSATGALLTFQLVVLGENGKTSLPDFVEVTVRSVATVQTPTITPTHTSTSTPTNTPTGTSTQTPTQTLTPTDTPTSVPTATLAAGCPAVPDDTCFSAGRSSVLFKDNSDTTKQKFSWKWSKGTVHLVQAAFGDPVNGTTTYTLCVYDQTGRTHVFKMGASVVPGGMCGTKPCWKAVSDKGWGYKNTNGNADGVSKVQLKGGAAGKPQVQVQGKGATLPLPAPTSGIEFFDQDPAVIVQLHSSSPANCWSSTFGGQSTKKNDGGQFKATTP